VHHRICMPEVELMQSNESIDHLTEDFEVRAVRSIMLAQAAHLHHGRVYRRA
jgi:hypothetical protein